MCTSRLKPGFRPFTRHKQNIPAPQQQHEGAQRSGSSEGTLHSSVGGCNSCQPTRYSHEQYQKQERIQAQANQSPRPTRLHYLPPMRPTHRQEPTSRRPMERRSRRDHPREQRRQPHTMGQREARPQNLQRNAKQPQRRIRENNAQQCSQTNANKTH